MRRPALASVVPARTPVRAHVVLLAIALAACGGSDAGTGPAGPAIRIDAPDRIVIGDTLRVTATRLDARGQPVPGESPALTIGGREGTYVPAGAGALLATDTGTITITATSGTERLERRVTVAMPAQLTLAIVSPDTARIGDSTVTLVADVRRDGAARAGFPARWTVRDTAVARVERRGATDVLVPLRAGDTELVARIGTATAARPLRVFGARLVNFAIDVTTQVLDVGDTATLAAGTFDATGALVPPGEVTFAVVTGGGVLQGARTVRGTAPGLVVVRASARGQEVIDTLTVVPPSAFTLEVRTGTNEAGAPGSVSPRAQAAIARAVKRWRQVIREELPPQPVRTNTAGACRAPLLDETVRGMVLFARELDLGTGIVAQAAACILRPDGRTVIGFMEVNSRFVQTLTDEQLTDTMIHEMAHALGFGSSWWRSDGFTRFVDAASTPVRWTGPVATANFGLLRNTAAYTGRLVPIMPDRGHWDGAVFRGETMEPFLRPQNRLSAITVGAMADMGYGVNERSWERYALPGIAATPSIAPLPLGDDVLPPYGVVAPDGTVRRLP